MVVEVSSGGVNDGKEAISSLSDEAGKSLTTRSRLVQL